MTFPVVLTGRSVNALAMIPVKIIMIKHLWQYVGVRVEKNQ